MVGGLGGPAEGVVVLDEEAIVSGGCVFALAFLGGFGGFGIEVVGGEVRGFVGGHNESFCFRGWVSYCD